MPSTCRSLLSRLSEPLKHSSRSGHKRRDILIAMNEKFPSYTTEEITMTTPLVASFTTTTQSSTTTTTTITTTSTPSTPPPTLSTLPPDILLEIFSHLPPTSYHALSLTSPSLRLFLHTHASTLSNNYIKTHYSLAHTLLSPTDIYSHGWLILTSQHRPNLLSAPGPYYLQFLSEYAVEIQIRAQMAGLVDSDGKLNLLESGDGDGEGGLDDRGEEEVLERERVMRDEFESAVMCFAIRPFLKRLDVWAERERARSDEVLEKKAGLDAPARTAGKLRERIGCGLSCGLVSKLCGRLRKGKESRLFGEKIEQDLEKGRCGGFWVDPTSKGLRWWGGVTGVRGCPVEDKDRLGWKESQARAEKNDEVSKINKWKGRVIMVKNSVLLGLTAGTRRIIPGGCFGEGFESLT